MKKLSLIWFVIYLQVSLCSEQDFVESWFNGASRRDTVLRIFANSANGMLYKMPTMPECVFPDPDANSSAVVVNTYVFDDDELPIYGKECYKEVWTDIVSSNCMGTCTSMKFEHNRRFEHVTHEECKKMIESFVAPGGKKLKVFGNGHWTTEENELPEPSWFFRKSTDQHKFVIMNIRVRVNEDTGIVKPLGTTTSSECHVDAAFCGTQKKGILMWTKTDHKICRLKVRDNIPCLRTGQLISCHGTSSTFQNWTTMDMCGVTVAVTESKIMFTTNVTGELHPEVMSHEDVVQKLKDSHGERVAFQPLGNTGVLSPNQFGVHFDYIVNTVRSEIQSVMLQYHLNHCRDVRASLKIHIEQAVGGDLNGFVRGMLNDPNLVADQAGDLINVWPGIPIDTYYFLPVSEERCTLEAKIEYDLEGEVRTGWLRPWTHEIVDVPKMVSCPNRPFNFVLQDGTVLDVTNNKIVKGVQTLPGPGIGPTLGSTKFQGYSVNKVFDPNYKPPKRTSAAEDLDSVIQAGYVMDEVRRGKVPGGNSTSGSIEEMGHKLGALLAAGHWIEILVGVVVIIIISVVLANGGLALIIKIISSLCEAVFNLLEELLVALKKGVKESKSTFCIWWRKKRNKESKVLPTFVHTRQEPFNPHLYPTLAIHKHDEHGHQE